MIAETNTAGLLRPRKGRLFQFAETVGDWNLQRRIGKVENEIKALVTQKNYPCVAALHSYHKDDYHVGLYGQFGSGKHWKQLRKDLLFYKNEQKRSGSVYSTFWAVFEEDEFLEENEFEAALWRELSYLTSEEDKVTDWTPDAVSDPTDPAFRFSLEGADFFVVGMHSQHSRISRKFPAPALVFNLFDQFAALREQGRFEPMAKISRDNDTRLQGEPNPMVIRHNNSWESIQFSGKKNPDGWKCPFHFFKRSEKP